MTDYNHHGSFNPADVQSAMDKLYLCCNKLREAINDGYIEYQSRDKRWVAGDSNVLLSDILFCPFCGTKLPS